MDQTIDSRPMKLLPIVDEHTRECLCLDVARSIKAADVIDTLRHWFAWNPISGAGLAVTPAGGRLKPSIPPPASSCVTCLWQISR